jgi:hypothetical protein
VVGGGWPGETGGAAVEATNEGKGQGVTVGGLVRGAGRRALTALEFQGLAAVAPRGRVGFEGIRYRRAPEEGNVFAY